VSGLGMKTKTTYPGYYKFSDEGGKGINGNLIYYIESEGMLQYDWFALNIGTGLTQVGLLRINQSIEAYVYCIMGSQVNLHSSILGQGSRAKKVLREFLAMVEEAITQTNLAVSVQNYQNSLDQAKVRLNLAVCPGTWLLPARMIINIENIVGYSDKLKQAFAGMKLGISNGVDLGTKNAALKLMAGGP